MPNEVNEPQRLEALGGTSPDWMEWLRARFDQKPFRARQVLAWLHGRHVGDPHQMTDLPPALRQRLAEQVTWPQAATAVRQDSADGTFKLLLTWPDGQNAETVMIPDDKRRTICVSSQVGCPVGCRFCASGVGGMKGNLSAARIVEQMWHVGRELAKRGERVSNIVFMGMGEPLANYASVTQAIRVLTDPRCVGLGARRITVSTVGVPTRIRQLADEGVQVNLALSLHAPTEPLRRELIPWAEHFALEDILAACRYYFDRLGREITLEYILLADVNDRPEHARQLGQLCRTLRCNVNLLRYNVVEGLPFVRPDAQRSQHFQRLLREQGVNAHLRRSRGRDIDAACGQLRKRQQESQREQLVQLT